MIIDPFLPYFWIIPCALFFACVGIYKEGWSRLNRALVPFGFLFFGFCVFLNVVAMGWYYAPFFFFILMYAVRGLPKNRVAYCLLVITMLDAVSMGVYSQSKSTVPLTYVATAKWLRENTSPDAKVATVEIGTIGWYDDRYTDDIIGLTNPANARRLRHHDFYSWLPDQQPDYVVMHQRPAFGEMAADKSKDYEYLPVHFGDITLMKRKDSTR
jgi:hypothetical protein